MTRREMRRAAMAVCDSFSRTWRRKARDWNVPKREIDEYNPRFSWWLDENIGGWPSWPVEASLLMSEACAPKWGVGK